MIVTGRNTLQKSIVAMKNFPVIDDATRFSMMFHDFPVNSISPLFLIGISQLAMFDYEIQDQLLGLNRFFWQTNVFSKEPRLSNQHYE